MIFHRFLFRKVTLVGVGLIGGSLGMALRERKVAREVVGLAQRHETLVKAQKSGAIDHGYMDLKKAVHQSDCVVLASPVSAIIGTLSRLGPHLKRNCLVTDVGSVKGAIVSAAQAHLSQPSCFVGSHPIAGSEKSGIDHARSDLFEGAVCLMTPMEKTNRLAKEKIKRLWIKVGCRVEMMSPENHDARLAYVSHMPHLAAFALMDIIPEEWLTLAGAGLKDTTRIAGSSPSLWSDISVHNAKILIQALDEYVRVLSDFRKTLSTKDPRLMENHLKTAQKKRLLLEKRMQEGKAA